MSRPWLSILIPVFNVGQYLQGCLNSIMVQVDSGVEIIALDDQSTDCSYEQLCNYAKTAQHPITIVQHAQNRGLSAARNSLIEAATGNYLWFLDSDDLLQAGAIKSLRLIIEAHSPDLILCDHQLWRSESAEVPAPVTTDSKLYISSFAGQPNCLLNDPDMLFSGLYAKGKLHAWSKIARRNLWESNLRFPEGRYFEDMVTTPRLARKINTYFYCPQPWVVYRQRQGSILASFNMKKIDDMISGLDGVLKLWQQPNLSDRSLYMFVRYALKIHAFSDKELKRAGIYTAELDASYLNKVLSHLGMNRKEVTYLMAKHDIFRALKFEVRSRKIKNAQM